MTMEETTFDALTRAVVRQDGTRRAVVRLLAGSALSMVVAHLGKSGEVEAKAKKPQQKGRSKSKHQQRTHRQGRPSRTHATPSGHVHSTGKKRHHHKQPDHPAAASPPSPPPLRPPCEGGLQQCPDGSCVSADQCCAGEIRCLDGPCVGPDQCCPGEQRCPEGSCVGLDDCCEDKKKCGSGCIYREACCEEEPYPLCGRC